MFKRFAVALMFALMLAPSLARADSWTDGQAEWARHGSKHGAWDCYGDCPSGRGHVSRSAGAPAGHPRASRAGFDGAWVISAAGPCLGAGTSQVMISGSRVMGLNGGGGHVTPGGTVNTVATINGVTIVGEGQILGRTASGIYRQSDGCTSSWSAVKL